MLSILGFLRQQKILITYTVVPQTYISCIKTPSRSLMSNKSPIIISKHHFEFLLMGGPPPLLRQRHYGFKWWVGGDN